MNKHYNSIPQILKNQQQWVVWGIVGEPPKAPFNPERLLKLKTEPAKSGVSDTWGTYEEAVRCVRQGLAQGIGYEFNNQGVYGVDLDHVISENGIITPQAQEIVEGLASYIVIPAGTWHNLINMGNRPLKVYSIYAPPEHPFGTVHETKEIAEEAEGHSH